MNKNEKDLAGKLKALGINAFKKAKQGMEQVKTGVENTILEEHLKRRFNLENPYKFTIMDESKKTSIIDGLISRHAKRYDEDDLFVFYGSVEHNGFKKGDIIRDLSVNADFKINDIVEVSVPVEYENKSYEVAGTAVVCDAL